MKTITKISIVVACLFILAYAWQGIQASRALARRLKLKQDKKELATKKSEAINKKKALLETLENAKEMRDEE